MVQWLACLIRNLRSKADQALSTHPAVSLPFELADKDDWVLEEDREGKQWYPAVALTVFQVSFLTHYISMIWRQLPRPRVDLPNLTFMVAYEGH